MPAKITSLSQPFIATGNFDDIDEFAAATTGWDLDFRQLQTGRPVMQLQVVAGQHAFLHRLSFSHAIHQQGTAPAGFTTLGFPDRTSSLQWAGRESSQAMMLDFNHPGGFAGISGSGFAGVTVSIANDMLASTGERLGLSTTEFVGSSQSLSLSHSDAGSAMDQLRKNLHCLCDRLPSDSPQQDLHWVIPALDEVPVSLFTIMAESQQPLRQQPLWARQKGLRLAISYIEEHAFENPGIPDICAASGLSWRSLNRVFKECFAIGPKRYLLNFRLIRVRQQLKAAPSNSKVIDLANGWGFWHMGDFAREYRRLFAEYPAELLKGNSRKKS